MQAKVVEKMTKCHAKRITKLKESFASEKKRAKALKKKLAKDQGPRRKGGRGQRAEGRGRGQGARAEGRGHGCPKNRTVY